MHEVIGLDTGFFIQLIRGHRDCVQLWSALGDSFRGVVSCITLAEIERLALRGKIELTAAETLRDAIPAVCEIIWIDTPDVLKRAARLSHGAGLSMIDAVILACLLAGGAETVWTTDANFQRYTGVRVQII